MLIVSQDGEEIFNFDRVTNTWIDTDVLDSKGEVFEICADGATLGYYKTEERAKEVLKEIAKKYENSMWKLGKNTLSFQDEFVYEMPKE